MKLLICTLLLAFLGQAFAQAPESTRLQDLLYLPGRGVVFGQTSVDWSHTTYKLESGSANERGRDISRRFNQEVRYGVTDRLQVNVAQSYLSKGVTNYNPDENVGDSKTSRAYGFYNPSVGLMYRVAEQPHQGFIFDVYANYTPDVVGRQMKQLSWTPSSLGSSYAVGARMGKKFTDWETSLNVSYLLHGTSKSVDSSTGDKLDTTSYGTLNLDWYAQQALGEQLFLRYGLNLSQSSATKIKDMDADTSSKLDPRLGTGFNFGAVVTVIPEKLVCDLILHFNQVANHDIGDGSVKKTQQVVVVAGARYQF